MKDQLKILLCAILCLAAQLNSHAQLAGALKSGEYTVGFRVAKISDSNGNPFQFCLWYPASQKGVAMTLAEYIDLPMQNGPSDKNILRKQLKETLELPFLFGLNNIPQKDFDAAIKAKTWATQNATMATGKWPIVIADAEPVTIVVTAEYLASHGYVVAVPAIMFPPPAANQTFWEAPTHALMFLTDHLMKQSFVDIDHIAAYGFGGGALAGFFTAMSRPQVKALINIEGAIFHPESKVPSATGYFPETCKAVLLDVGRPEILGLEDQLQFDKVKSSKFKVTINAPGIRHHDFSIYGRTVNTLLKLRGSNSRIADDVFVSLHIGMLYFLKNLSLNKKSLEGSGFFSVE